MPEVASEATPTANGTDSGPPRGSSLASIVGQLCHAIGNVLPPGDNAELRRLDAQNPLCPAFFKLMVSIVEQNFDLPENGPARDVIERRWAAVFQAAAILAGLHDPKRPLGEALISSGYSELRFVRLLRARGNGIFTEMRTAARFLSAKSERCDVNDLARLVLMTDSDKAESARLSIARSYYRRSSDEHKEG